MSDSRDGHALGLPVPDGRGTAGGARTPAPAVPLPDEVADLARRIHDSRPQVVPFADVAFRLRQAGHSATVEQVRAAIRCRPRRGLPAADLLDAPLDLLGTGHRDGRAAAGGA
jgi:hypothetical protein